MSLQETCDKVKDDGTVVYIAGPDPSLANNSSIFPNLEQNQVCKKYCALSYILSNFYRQAFVMTRHLPVMGREGRVIVVKFGYSNLKTLPTVIFHIFIFFVKPKYKVQKSKSQSRDLG